MHGCRYDVELCEGLRRERLTLPGDMDEASRVDSGPSLPSEHDSDRKQWGRRLGSGNSTFNDPISGHSRCFSETERSSRVTGSVVGRPRAEKKDHWKDSTLEHHADFFFSRKVVKTESYYKTTPKFIQHSLCIISSWRSFAA